MTLSLGLHLLLLSAILINPAKKVLPQIKNPNSLMSVEIVQQNLSPAPTGDLENQSLTSQPIISNSDAKEVFESQPPFLIGSPWNRRPLDRPGNFFRNSPPSNGFNEINLELQKLGAGNEPKEAVECTLKNLATKPAYECNFPENAYFKKNVEEILNAQLFKSLTSLPNCISLLNDKKNWHAKACQ
jgi:hypothetical protein